MKEKCIECSTELIGRADKRFCSDQCRSTYYNRENKEALVVVKSVNKILRKNYKILRELNPNGKMKIKREDILRKGFDFNYITGFYTTKAERTYYFVYDQGYTELDDDYYALVVKKEYIR